jgi:hypothetical protein
MEKPVIMIPPSRLKSPLIPAAAVLYLLAALAGLPGVVLLANPEYRAFLMQDLASSGITDASSLNSFQLINSVVTLLACFGPALISAGLLISLRGKPVQGIGLLSTAAQWLIYGVNASGCVAAVVFVFRFFRYLFIFGSDARRLVAVYSMILCEALMGTQAVFLFFQIRKFLNCCIDSCTSIAYTLATGKLDDRSIPSFSGTGFLIISIVGMVLAINRLFTLTAVIRIVHSYYKLVVASHPGLWAEGICLILGSAANFLMYRYLRQYKKQTEQALYEARNAA